MFDRPIEEGSNAGIGIGEMVDNSDPPMFEAGLVTGIVFFHVCVWAFEHDGLPRDVAVGHTIGQAIGSVSWRRK